MDRFKTPPCFIGSSSSVIVVSCFTFEAVTTGFLVSTRGSLASRLRVVSATLDLVSKMDVEDPRYWWTLCPFEGWGWVARLIVSMDTCR